jgi:lipopolysaccharide transport system ATP-binding protein
MISIQAKELGKAYNIYKKPIDSLKEWLFRRSYHETFWALQGVDLMLPQGAALGVIGENGAGKTTLLQLLAGTIKPTCGQVERNGRVSAILELGSGFHPELSGLENIRLGCATLGLSPAETEKRIPEIIAFSELDRFVERPVKTYSTGMYMRLAFSVATSVEPDILVVDEALSVGDLHFQKKCIDRIMAFREQGKTLVFCTHALHYIRQICDHCLWLQHGKPEMFGTAMEVVDCYEDYERSLDAKSTPESDTEPGTAASHTDETRPERKRESGETHIREVFLGGDCDDGRIETGGTLTVHVFVRLAPAAKKEGAHIAVEIHRNDGIKCYGVSTEMDNTSLYPLGGDEYGVCFVVEELPLLSGQYSLTVALMDSNGVHIYDWSAGVAPFTVRHDTKELGVTRLKHRWERP